MKFKKTIAAFITFSISLSSLHFTGNYYADKMLIAIAADNYKEFTENGLIYNIYDDHIELVGCTEDIKENVVIPDVINNTPVTIIAEDAFMGLEILKSVTIPETVTEIDDYAFCRCNNLEKIEGMKNIKSIGWASFSVCEKLKELTLPNSLETIGAYAFNECKSLTVITIPDSVTDLGAGAFFECEELISVKLSDNITELKSEKDEYSLPTPYYGTFGKCLNLKEIVLPDKLEKIGEGSFDACCALETINIPKNVKEIGDAAFRTANISYGLTLGGKATSSSLKEITVDNANSYFCSVDGILYNKEGTKLIQYPLGRIEREFIVPKSVTIIGNSAFYDNPIYNITFLGNIEEIDDEAFWCCSNLKGVELPQSLKRIGKCAFGNSRFYNIIIPDSVEEIGWDAFFYTRLEEIRILNPNCRIGNDNYSNNSTISDTTSGYFRGIIYGYKNSTAQEYAQKNHIKFIDINDESETIIENGLKYNIYSDHAEVIGSEATIGELITIPAEIRGVPVTEIGKRAFINSRNKRINIKNVNLPDTITKIDDYAFSFTEIEKIVIPSNVCEIGYEAFSHCSKLNEVTLPNSLSYIGLWAFDACPLLTEILIPRSVEKIEYAAFGTSGTGKTIYGYKDTAAQSYAQKYSFNFIELSEGTVTTTTSTATTTSTIVTITTITNDIQPVDYNLGDVNNDSHINAVDASSVLSYYAMVSTNKNGGFNDNQKAAADVHDGLINAVDASCILSYYAYVSTTKEDIKSLEEFLKK